MVSSMARGRLKLSLRPRLILTTDTDWDSDTDSDTALDTPDTSDTPDTVDMDSDTAMDSSTARGLLMLRPIPTTPTDSDTPDTMVLVTLDTMVSDSDTTAMDSDTPTARGRLILTTDTVLDTDTVSDTDTVLDTSDMPDTSDTPDMADTTTASRLHQVLSANQQLDFKQKWIVISLKFPSPVLQFQCYHTKSLVMVSRKQENQSGKIPTNIKMTQKKKKKKKKKKKVL